METGDDYSTSTESMSDNASVSSTDSASSSGSKILSEEQRLVSFYYLYLYLILEIDSNVS